MESLRAYMLDKAISWILGGDIFARIKDIVAGLMDVDAPGEQKRELAIKQAKGVAADVANFILNLGIEAAVYLLKQKQRG
jgi:hypothetical protein